MQYGFLFGVVSALVAGCGPAERSPLTREEVVEGIEEWVAERDQDGDEQLNRLEWQTSYERDFPDVPDTDRQQWSERDFRDYDSNGDGFVGTKELAALAIESFDCHDADGDGRLSASEPKAAPEADCPSRQIIVE